METQDEVMPEGRWAFDAEVTSCFDDMLQRSIPQYDVMRQAVTDIAKAYAVDYTDIVDLGCSRGEAMAPIISLLGAHNRFLGVEVSEPMREATRERFAGYIKSGIVDVVGTDLRHAYPPVRASVTLLVLTLQFIPIEYRQTLLRAIYNHTIPGGVLILVEKVLGASADIDALMVKTYYGLKAANGYSQDQIERKRLSLEGVLVPVTAEWNTDMLRQAGFTQMDCFWRWMNFAGWVAVRP